MSSTDVTQTDHLNTFSVWNTHIPHQGLPWLVDLPDKVQPQCVYQGQMVAFVDLPDKVQPQCVYQGQMVALVDLPDKVQPRCVYQGQMVAFKSGQFCKTNK